MSDNSNKIGVVFDPAYLRHDTGPGHPESSERLQSICRMLDAFPNIPRIAARRATREELQLIHRPEYVDKILNMNVTEIEMLDPDTAVSPASKEAALIAAGGVLEAVRLVLDGSFENVFCAVRPPGHHAESDKAMGFCLFNNIAIGAAWALNSIGTDKVAIVDWDLHHGNGTQNAFYESNRVLYISLHQYPFYPGTGSSLETGTGEGEGFTVNVPMGAGSDDRDYRDAFEATVLPALDDFKPQLMMISAGFDAHRDDPLGYIDLSTEYFGEMTSNLKDLAGKYCKGRIVSVLEGGYHSGLSETVRAHLSGLAR